MLWLISEYRGYENIQWDSDEVKNIFAGFTLPPKAEKKKTSTGAIAGGAVGGVAGLLAISALAFWFVRRRKRATRPIDSPGEDGPEKSARKEGGPGENATELDAYREHLPTQELDGSHYQELDGGWAEAEAAGRHDRSPGSVSELHAEIPGSDSSRRNVTVSPEIPR